MLEIGAAAVRVLWEGRQPNISYAAAASPDGRLVATASYAGGSGVRIWEADSGKVVHELQIGDAYPACSANGRWLYTTTGRLAPGGSECRSWLVGSWKPGPSLALNRVRSSPARIQVAADGPVAVQFTINEVRLLDPETLVGIATLVAPDQRMLAGFQFRPNGEVLAVANPEKIELWDLRRLRQELADLGLDWERPPYPSRSRLDGSPGSYTP
jgi:WD40 repeat protein